MAIASPAIDYMVRFEQLYQSSRAAGMPAEMFDEKVKEIRNRALTTTWGTADQQLAAIRSAIQVFLMEKSDHDRITR